MKSRLPFLLLQKNEMAKLQCQRIGCNAVFSENDNPDGSCIYHESGPLFHDGIKEWSCCKKRSHDFSLFLEIPGCKTGKHTTEKPAIVNKASPVGPKWQPCPVPSPTDHSLSKNTCARCRQGFFCSDHGSQTPTATASAVEPPQPPKQQKKIVDVNQPQTCRNKGCGRTFKEKDNHETACSYHPGPAIFHDRMRGWKCCDVHVKEFDEFMSIEPCAKGWHDAADNA